MKPGGSNGDRGIDRNDAIGETRKYFFIEPSPEDGALGDIPPLHLKRAAV